MEKKECAEQCIQNANFCLKTERNNTYSYLLTHVLRNSGRIHSRQCFPGVKQCGLRTAGEKWGSKEENISLYIFLYFVIVSFLNNVNVLPYQNY